MNIHAIAVPTFIQMLKALSHQLDKAAAFAAEKGIAPAELIGARLAPDMFPLASQVRFTCIQACEAMSHLAGQSALDLAADETSIEGLKCQIAKTVLLLEATPPAAFDGADTRPVALAMPNGIAFDMTGEQYVRDWALPQFYFHLVAAYAVLRQLGVDLGKPDYVSHMRAYIRPGTAPVAA